MTPAEFTVSMCSIRLRDFMIKIGEYHKAWDNWVIYILNHEHN